MLTSQLSREDEGSNVLFTYNGKHRRGVVVEVEMDQFTIELPESQARIEGTNFKSFKHNKVQGMISVAKIGHNV
jgi:hypothetical protein